MRSRARDSDSTSCPGPGRAVLSGCCATGRYITEKPLFAASVTASTRLRAPMIW
jgi:hypothetical protein